MIDRELAEAGVTDDSNRQELARKLSEHLAGDRGRTGRPPGRPPEKDEEELLAIARLVRKGNNPHAAARQVTAKLPESKREAALQRLYRKFKKKDPEFWLSKALPTLPTIQEEIERLRELLGPGADRFDYGKFLRRIQRDPEF
jgi:hypothetical protein